MGRKLWSSGDLLTSSDLNQYLSNQVVTVCTSGTRPASPTEGMVIYETDTDQIKVYNGTAWRRTGAFDQETYGQGAANDGTSLTAISSTTFIAGSPVVGFTFKAPPSGGVYVTVSGYVIQANDTFETRLSFEIRTGTTVGSGTIHTGTSSVRCINAGRAVNTGAASVTCGSFEHPATGLTPLADYNVRTMHAVTGSSGGQIDYRALIVKPML